MGQFGDIVEVIFEGRREPRVQRREEKYFILAKKQGRDVEKYLKGNMYQIWRVRDSEKY